MQDRLGVSPAYRLLRSFWVAVDWIYPARCGGCQQSGIRWCATCEAQTEQLHHRSVCPVCGIPQTDNHECDDCRQQRPDFTALRSWAIYKSAVREAIHRLKYRSDLGLSDIFAEKLHKMLIPLDWSLDMVTAVPLSPGRMKERGFNQADLLAHSLALALRLPYRPSAVKRVRETQSQVGLSAAERIQNVHQAFQANVRMVAGKNVLIVDDVTTTGATISECSRACKEAGATTVFGVTIARAVLSK